MQLKLAATFFQYKVEYYCTMTLRKPVIIAWSFHITGNRNLWLPPMDVFVNPNKPAVILICQEKPAKL